MLSAIGLLTAATFALTAFAALADCFANSANADPPLQFSARFVSAPWCPEHRALAASILASSGSEWAPRPASDYTVYVNDALISESLFKVAPAAVTVCVPSTGWTKVLIFGPDTRGRPAEFDSSGTSLP